MMDVCLLWSLHNPLQCVAGLAGFAILIGVLLVPRLWDISHHGHPRC